MGGRLVLGRVTPLLARDGGSVLAPSLVGLGEPGAGGAPGTGLEAHVDQVCELLAGGDVDDAVLVGHSYGGMVITGVAARHPERVRRLVYVDAFVPEPGQSCFDIFPWQPALFDQLESGGLVPPPPLAPLFALSEDEIAWIGDRMRPMPRLTHSQSVARYAPALLDERTPTFVLCKGREDFAATAEGMAERGWRVLELTAHHYAMVSMPETLAAIIRGEVPEDPAVTLRAEGRPGVAS